MKIRNLFTGFAAVLALTLSVWAQTGSGSPAAPKIVIAKVEHSLGEVRRGETARHTFTFRNEGKSDLEIKNVAPACGCTASEFTKVVPPGQEGRIVLSISTAGFNGALSKTAEVYTNDPAKERFTLMLNLVVVSDESPKGQAVGPFFVGPGNQWIGRSPLGMSSTGLISVMTAGAEPIRLTNLDAGGKAFEVTLQTLEEGKRYGVSFVSSAELPLGTHRQTVKLTTDSKQHPVLELQLEVTVLPAVTFNPTSIAFESVPVSDPELEISLVSKFLWIRLGRGTGLEVTSVTSDLPFVKVKQESNDANGQQIIMRVGFSEKPPKGTHTGTIKVQTNNPMMKAFEIPITVTAK